LHPLVGQRKLTNGVRAAAAAARRRGQSVFATLLHAAGAPLPLTSPCHLA